MAKVTPTLPQGPISNGMGQRPPWVTEKLALQAFKKGNHSAAEAPSEMLHDVVLVSFFKPMSHPPPLGEGD